MGLSLPLRGCLLGGVLGDVVAKLWGWLGAVLGGVLRGCSAVRDGLRGCLSRGCLRVCFLSFIAA